MLLEATLDVGTAELVPVLKFARSSGLHVHLGRMTADDDTLV